MSLIDVFDSRNTIIVTLRSCRTFTTYVKFKYGPHVTLHYTTDSQCGMHFLLFPPLQIAETFAVTGDFFRLDHGVKMECARSDKTCNNGYVPMETESLVHIALNCVYTKHYICTCMYV